MESCGLFLEPCTALYSDRSKSSTDHLKFRVLDLDSFAVIYISLCISLWIAKTMWSELMAIRIQIAQITYHVH